MNINNEIDNIIWTKIKTNQAWLKKNQIDKHIAEQIEYALDNQLFERVWCLIWEGLNEYK